MRPQLRAKALWKKLATSVKMSALDEVQLRKFQQAQHASLEKADIVADVDTHEDLEMYSHVRASPINYQARILEQDALMLRYSLRKDKRIDEVVRGLWSFEATRDEFGCLRKEGYMAFYVSVAKYLDAEFEGATAVASVASEWDNDRKGQDTMGYALFFESLFQLADVWVDSLDVKDYIVFLENIAVNIFLPGTNVLRDYNDIIFINASAGDRTKQEKQRAKKECEQKGTRTAKGAETRLPKAEPKTPGKPPTPSKPPIGKLETDSNATQQKSVGGKKASPTKRVPPTTKGPPMSSGRGTPGTATVTPLGSASLDQAGSYVPAQAEHIAGAGAFSSTLMAFPCDANEENTNDESWAAGNRSAGAAFVRGSQPSPGCHRDNNSSIDAVANDDEPLQDTVSARSPRWEATSGVAVTLTTSRFHSANPNANGRRTPAQATDDAKDLRAISALDRRPSGGLHDGAASMSASASDSQLMSSTGGHDVGATSFSASGLGTAGLSPATLGAVAASDSMSSSLQIGDARPKAAPTGGHRVKGLHPVSQGFGALNPGPAMDSNGFEDVLPMATALAPKPHDAPKTTMSAPPRVGASPGAVPVLEPEDGHDSSGSRGLATSYILGSHEFEMTHKGSQSAQELGVIGGGVGPHEGDPDAQMLSQLDWSQDKSVRSDIDHVAFAVVGGRLAVSKDRRRPVERDVAEASDAGSSTDRQSHALDPWRVTDDAELRHEFQRRQLQPICNENPPRISLRHEPYRELHPVYMTLNKQTLQAPTVRRRQRIRNVSSLPTLPRRLHTAPSVPRPGPATFDHSLLTEKLLPNRIEMLKRRHKTQQTHVAPAPLKDNSWNAF
ncbi:hypothetical protein ACHHYP_07652 [Achlya hypogyna]|uniref:Uncharacterized protein n=1 Tax=Achlya hypogyna TaxID=1202772 RepID=A0A1V9YQW8_ACHHY|nr:hypothetical protein ACHHYP_07652 [Achlya hypogyna]